MKLAVGLLNQFLLLSSLTKQLAEIRDVSLEEKMPLFGTNDVNTGDSNSLYLPTKTIGYMFRPIGWAAVDMTGWTEVSMGAYLGGHGSDIRMYTKEFEPGSYTIDNYSAMYQFIFM